MNNGVPSNPQRIGKYELRERLGSGGMAEVWKAYDPQLERFVAIKLLHPDLQTDPDFLTRFVREARVIASLHHPNIIQIHDFQTLQPADSSSPVAYMIMDYIEGQTLAHFIRSTSRVGKFPTATEIVQLFASISRAVDYAHQHGMIHRDIKPANILLDQRNRVQNPMGEPVLTDFGIARIIGISTGTASGSWLGTPIYIAPEQAMGQPGTERSDIYSLGIILYEICTGVQPFRGENVSSIMMQQVHAIPTAPSLINPNIPPALSMVILHCLAKDPIARFSSAAALAAALAEALNVSLPPDISQHWMSAEQMSQPTLLSPIKPGSPTGVIPSLTPASPPGTAQIAQSGSPALSPLPASIGTKQINPTTPFPGSFTPTHSVSGQQAALSSPPFVNAPPLQTPVFAPPSPPAKIRRKGLVILLILLVILLLGGGVGAFFWFSHQGSAPGNTIVGHAYFISSGQTNEQSNQGINDELLIEIQNVASPAQGKSYYGWLLGDVSMPLASPVFLGTLPVANGSIHYLYPGDAKHTNLIDITSRFLITEEDASVQPVGPTTDKSAWVYSAQLPQSPNTSDMMNAGALQHLRHLLANAPELTAINLQGGLDLWLFRNAEKVFEWAGSARDDWERRTPLAMHDQCIYILDYLDGKAFVQQDVPPGTPNLVNPRIAPVALLPLGQPASTPVLLSLVDSHLSALVQAPGISQENHELAAQIDQDINKVLSLLKQVRLDALQLFRTPISQLLTTSTLSLLDTMETQARYAYIGQVDPNTNTVQGGVVQIHYNIQHLATLDITAM